MCDASTSPDPDVPKWNATTQTVTETRDVGTHAFMWELTVRRAVKEMGFYIGKVWRLERRYFQGLANALSRPAGRADKEGSQECIVEVECATLEPLEDLFKSQSAKLTYHPSQRCILQPDGSHVFTKSNNTSTFFCNDARLIADFFDLHNRNLPSDLILFCSSKGVAPTMANGHLSCHVTVMALPPLIIELVQLPQRNIVRTMFNKGVHNDLNGFHLPPHFLYPPHLGPMFKALMLEHVLGMHNERAHEMSCKFVDLAIAP
jgi:hypothetical protein